MVDNARRRTNDHAVAASRPDRHWPQPTLNAHELPPLSQLGQRILFGSRPACAGMDPEMWFPTTGGDTSPARRVCASCPVADDCLTFALEIGATGVWGGTDDEQRRAIRHRDWARSPQALST